MAKTGSKGEKTSGNSNVGLRKEKKTNLERWGGGRSGGDEGKGKKKE